MGKCFRVAGRMLMLLYVVMLLALCPEHPKRDQNPKFTPLFETTSIPVCFIWGNQRGGNSVTVAHEIPSRILVASKAVFLENYLAFFLDAQKNRTS